MTVEVLDVRITTQDKLVLPEAKYLKQDLIVEALGSLDVRRREVDVVQSCDFSHGVEMRMRGLNV